MQTTYTLYVPTEDGERLWLQGRTWTDEIPKAKIDKVQEISKDVKFTLTGHISSGYGYPEFTIDGPHPDNTLRKPKRDAGKNYRLRIKKSRHDNNQMMGWYESIEVARVASKLV